MTQKSGHSNRLYDAVKNVYSNIFVAAQLAVMGVFQLTVFGSFWERSGTYNQFKCISMDQELYNLMSGLVDALVEMQALPWIDEDSYTLIPFMRGEQRTPKTMQLLNAVLKPDHLPAEDVPLFQMATKAMITGLATGMMKKLHAMPGPDYGNLRMIDANHNRYLAQGTGTR